MVKKAERAHRDSQTSDRPRSAILSLFVAVACVACGRNEPTGSSSGRAASSVTTSAPAPRGFRLTERCSFPGAATPRFELGIDSDAGVVDLVLDQKPPKRVTLGKDRFATLETLLESPDLASFIADKPKGKLEEGEVVSCKLHLVRGGNALDHEWASNDDVSEVSKAFAKKLETELTTLRHEAEK